MSPGTVMTRRVGEQTGRRGFRRLLRAEWIKFRTVRGWVTGMAAAALLTVLVGLFAAGSANIVCPGGRGRPAKTGPACLPYVPIGPGGEAVTDSFYFVHRSLAGNGSITVRLTSLTGRYSSGLGRAGQGSSAMRPGLQPWSKAGIIIKASLKQGSAYAAMTVTGGHGVRMQYDYTGDIAGSSAKVSAASPRWLRLTRSGNDITGYESGDGTHWARVGTARLTGLPAKVQAGLFATSPPHSVTSSSFGGSTAHGGPSRATGVFDHLSLSGRWTAGAWAGTAIGGGAAADTASTGGGYHQATGRFTVTGSGDIAPAGPGAGFPSATIEDHLAGAFAGLVAVVVVAVLFITSEYRRGLIRTTLAAAPHRGQVLAAKAIVIGVVTFITGLAAAVVLVAAGTRLSAAQGLYVLPVSPLTEIRVIAGTGALLAVAAVFALGVGTLLRRSAAAVTTAIVATVLTYILGVASVLPVSAEEWLLRVTPAAGFAIQQSIPAYHQVAALYAPPAYFPLPPWGGFAVLCGWAAAALGLAFVQLRRRDA